MCVIFLDSDGVTHGVGHGDEAAVHFQWFHVLVQMLDPWPDVNLAVHSTWRYHHTPKELQALLDPLCSRFIGAAPRCPRAEAILWFLHLNPSITRYLVLDDAPQDFPADIPGDLVFCDSRSGVSAPKVQARIRAWLDRATQTPN